MLRSEAKDFTYSLAQMPYVCSSASEGYDKVGLSQDSMAQAHHMSTTSHIEDPTKLLLHKQSAQTGRLAGRCVRYKTTHQLCLNTRTPKQI